MGEGRRKYKETGDRSIVVKTLWAQFESLVIHEDMLYRKNPHSEANLQAIVPASERRIVLTHSHDNRSSGTPGNKEDFVKNPTEFLLARITGRRKTIRNWMSAVQ